MSVAPWPLIDDIKTALKLPMNDLSQDGEIEGWIAASESLIQLWTNETIASTPYTDVDRTPDTQPLATFAAPRVLIMNHMPVDLRQPITVKAYDGSTTDTIAANPSGPPYYSTTQMFYVDPLKGLLYAVVPGDITFASGPYVISYNAGLVAHPMWASRYRAICGRIVRDLCSVLQENPAGVASMSAGGGIAETFIQDCLPKRTKLFLNLLPNGGAKVGIGV